MPVRTSMCTWWRMDSSYGRSPYRTLPSSTTNYSTCSTTCQLFLVCIVNQWGGGEILCILTYVCWKLVCHFSRKLSTLCCNFTRMKMSSSRCAFSFFSFWLAGILYSMMFLIGWNLIINEFLIGWNLIINETLIGWNLIINNIYSITEICYAYVSYVISGDVELVL